MVAKGQEAPAWFGDSIANNTPPDIRRRKNRRNPTLKECLESFLPYAYSGLYSDEEYLLFCEGKIVKLGGDGSICYVQKQLI